jgi:hypothetical protein
MVPSVMRRDRRQQEEEEEEEEEEYPQVEVTMFHGCREWVKRSLVNFQIQRGFVRESWGFY